MKRDLLEPAIQGTLSILKSAKLHGLEISRVVITSSFAAMLDVQAGARPGYLYTEEDWNPLSYAEAETADVATAYCASKALAEKAAFDLSRKKDRIST